MALKKGTKAPEIKLKSTDGSEFSLSRDMAGKPCIIYFYPKDFTPGCTKEACSFRDNIDFFKNLDVTILGVSRDSVAQHEKFKARYKLPYELLSDMSGKVSKAYDAYVPFLGISKRITYLIDANGKIAAVYSNLLGAEKHIKEMINKLKRA